MAIETRSTTIETADGLHLVGDIVAPPDPWRAAAVVCHPHPLYGGDRFNAVVEAVVRCLADHGVGALRFDFRGVGASEGEHGDGIGERLDVVGAIDVLAAEPRAAGVPIWLVGYSFGAVTVLGVDDPRVTGWVAIAPPLTLAREQLPAAVDSRRTHVILAGHDQFTKVDEAVGQLASWAATTHDVVPSADHFLAGHLPVVAEITRLAIVGADV